MINEIEKIYDADNNHFGYEMRLTDGKILNVPLDTANTDYQAIQEQLDMQYWDKVNGTTNWEDAIAKVKSDIAKP